MLLQAVLLIRIGQKSYLCSLNNNHSKNTEMEVHEFWQSTRTYVHTVTTPIYHRKTSSPSEDHVATVDSREASMDMTTEVTLASYLLPHCCLQHHQVVTSGTEVEPSVTSSLLQWNLHDQGCLYQGNLGQTFPLVFLCIIQLQSH